MNKKRIGLVLSASMIISAVVGPGVSGPNTVRANASQIAPHLNEDEAALLKDIVVKNLVIDVNEVAAGKVEISFSNITTDQIKNVTVKNGKHELFKERETEDGHLDGEKVTPTFAFDSKTKKVGVSGVTTPGIYSGDFDIEFQNGLVETYKVSFTKMPAHEYLDGKVEVTTVGIVAKGLKVMGESELIALADGDLVSLYKEGQAAPVFEDVEYKADKGVVFPFASGQLNEGDKFKLEYKYGTGDEYSATKELVVVKSKPVLDPSMPKPVVFGDNGDDIKNAIKKAYSAVPDVADPVLDSSAGTVSIEKIGTVLSFEQDFSGTGSAAKPAGGKVTATVDPEASTLTITAIEAKTTPTSPANVPAQTIILKPSAAPGRTETIAAGDPDGILGKYLVNGEVYFNAEDGVELVAESENTAGGTGTPTPKTVFIKETTGKVLKKDIAPSGLSMELDIEMEHGINAVQLDFTHQPGDITVDSLTTKLDALKDKLVAETEGLVVTKTIPEISGNGVAASVTTPVVFAVDMLDAIAVDAAAERVNNNTLEFTLKGGASLLTKEQNTPGSAESNKVRELLTITGGTVETFDIITEGDKNDIVFTVKFAEEIPANLNWTFTNTNTALASGELSFSGQVATTSGAVVGVNLKDKVTLSNDGQDGTNVLQVVASFKDNLPQLVGAPLKYGAESSLFIPLAKLGEGSQVISAEVGTGKKYQGKYEAGVWVSRSSFKISLEASKVTNKSIKVIINGVDLYPEDTKKGLEKVTNVTVKFTNKKDDKDVKTVELSADQLTKLKTTGTVELTQADLKAEETYTVMVDASIVDGEVVKEAHTAIKDVSLAETGAGGGLVSGDRPSTSGSSVGETEIKLNNNNSSEGSTTITFEIPREAKVDTKIDPVVYAISYRDEKGNTVNAKKEQFSNVKVTFDKNGDIHVQGLVPGKNYRQIKVDYTDDKGKVRTFVLSSFTLDSSDKLENFLADVYVVSLGRHADENGYSFHLANMRDHKTSLRGFLLNLLSEKEFLGLYKSTEEKINALYAAILSREPDKEGKEFWMKEYEQYVAIFGSDSLALAATAERMVNEKELKELADKLGVLY